MAKVSLTNTYKTYPEYKDSGVDWVGQIPQEWETTKIKNAIRKQFSGIWGEDSLMDNNDIQCLRVADFNFDKLTYKPVETIRNIQPNDLLKKELPLNSILLEKSGGGEKQAVGRVIVYDSREKMVCANFIDVLEVNKSYSPCYFAYFLKATYQSGLNKKAIKQNTGIQNLDTKAYFQEAFVSPPKAEQEKIAAFLDVQTARIDASIAKKKRLIELLKEKRTATINQAVTKGLDPKAELTESGIDWIGKIPKGWAVKKIKYIGYFKSGESITSEMISPEGEYPVYGGNGLRGHYNKFTHNGTHILIGRQGALCGNINYAKEKFWASEHAVVVTLITDVDLYWFGELLNSMNLGQYSVSAAQPGLAVEKIKNFSVPVPSKTIQLEISATLKKLYDETESIISKTETSVELLKELKSSLISHAVTGKIKV
jgi:type I restriction enzyme S subunit